MISSRVLASLRGEFRRSLMAKIGVVLILVVVFAAVFAPFLATQHPKTQELEKSNLPPVGLTQTTEEIKFVDGERKTVSVTVEGSLEHPLGTNQLGQDLYSRTLYGARTSLLVGIFGTAIAALAGVSVGLLAGYYGGRVDDVLMRVADIMLAFPALVLAIALIGLLGPKGINIPDPFVAAGLVSDRPSEMTLPLTVTLVIALVNWVWFARVARGEALSVREKSYVKASRSLGASDRRLMLKHVLPNSLTPIIVLATVQIAVIIVLESALSFLGFSGTNLSWGFDINQGRDLLATSWWISTVPGMAIVLTVVGINLVGDWLRDALDPDIEGQRGGGG